MMADENTTAEAPVTDGGAPAATEGRRAPRGARGGVVVAAVTTVAVAIVVAVMAVVRPPKKMMARSKSSSTSTAFRKRLRAVSALVLLRSSLSVMVKAA